MYTTTVYYYSVLYTLNRAHALFSAPRVLCAYKIRCIFITLSPFGNQVSQILASEEEGVAVSSEEVEMEAALKADTALKEGADALLKHEGVEAGEELPVIPLAVEGASNKAKTAAEEEKAMAEEEAEKATAEQVAVATVEEAATVEKAEEEVVVLEEVAATAAKAEARTEERTHDLARRKSKNLADKA